MELNYLLNIKPKRIPVLLAKNGHTRNALPNTQDFEKKQATLQLMNELAKSQKSNKEEGGFTLKGVEKNLSITK